MDDKISTGFTMGRAVFQIFVAANLIPLCLFGATCAEQYGVRQRTSLSELSSVVKDSGEDLKAAHVIGRLDSKSYVTDPTFLKEGRYLKVRRMISMYQWTEKEIEDHGRRTGRYTYSKQWASGSGFPMKGKDAPENPKLPIHSKEFVAHPIMLGEHQTVGVIEHAESEPLPLTSNVLLEDFESHLYDEYPALREMPLTKQPTYLQFGNDDVLGSVRVSFKSVWPDTYTVVGGIQNGVLGEFKDSAGTTQLLVKRGSHSSQTLVSERSEHVQWWVWFWRILFFFILCFCWAAIYSGVRDFSKAGKNRLARAMPLWICALLVITSAASMIACVANKYDDRVFMHAVLLCVLFVLLLAKVVSSYIALDPAKQPV